MHVIVINLVDVNLTLTLGKPFQIIAKPCVITCYVVEIYCIVDWGITAGCNIGLREVHCHSDAVCNTVDLNVFICYVLDET